MKWLEIFDLEFSILVRRYFVRTWLVEFELPGNIGTIPYKYLCFSPELDQYIIPENIRSTSP